tara:strand:+ start:5832 stop:6197 length:366 start_codon:yes stop_codon:yes gene_type:complete
MTNLIEEIEKSQMKKDGVPSVSVGDTVCVSKVIVEGKKQRIQKYEGLVIGIQGRYSKKRINIRKFVDKIGVEKSFLIHSPLVKDIKVVSKGKVRRAKLNYLRERVGSRATKVKKKITNATT